MGDDLQDSVELIVDMVRVENPGGSLVVPHDETNDFEPAGLTQICEHDDVGGEDAGFIDSRGTISHTSESALTALADAIPSPSDDLLIPTNAFPVKKKRVRRKWDPCDKCESKHGKRFGYIQDQKFVYLACDKCRSDDMKDLSRVCKCSGKDIRYGPPGGPATHCFSCKGPHMVNLRPSSGYCECGSSKVRRYGMPNGSRTNCLQCKSPDMVNLSLSNKTEGEFGWGGHCDCGSNKTRRFGVPGGKRSHCMECKQLGMINLTQRLCSCGSERQIRYGYSSGSATHCSACRKDDMSDLTKRTRRLCPCGSERQIRFGISGGVATKCSKCREDLMVDLTKKRQHDTISRPGALIDDVLLEHAHHAPAGASIDTIGGESFSVRELVDTSS